MRHRRSARVAALLAAALTATVLGAGGGTAQAEPELTDDQNEVVLGRVYGTHDPRWPLRLGGPDGVTAVLDEAGVEPWANTVYGTALLPDGAALGDATAILELVDPATGTLGEVARTVTNSAGGFVLDVHVDEPLIDAAKDMAGTLNFVLTVVKDVVVDGYGYATYRGVGGIYSAMMAYNGGLSGLAMAPVNVGSMYVASHVSPYAGGLPDTTPADDPYDPNTPTQSGMGYPSPIGERVADVEMVQEPRVEIPQTILRDPGGVTVDPPELPDPYSDKPREQEDANGGDFRCHSTENQGRHLIDEHINRNKFQIVGEVHAWDTMKVQYVYSERANTQLGFAIKPEGKGWKVSGASYVTNEAKATGTLEELNGRVALPVEAEFVHVYQKRTWCPHGYNEGRGPYASHDEIVFTTKWTGGAQYGTRNLPGDGTEAYKKALAEARAATMTTNYTFDKDEGRTYKYTFEVSAFGVGLYAVSENDARHKLTLKTTTHKRHAFGDKDVPASPKNKAIYVAP